MALIQVEPVPGGGGVGVVAGGVGGSFGGPPALGTSLDVPVVAARFETWVVADGAVGEPLHHVDARAHPTSNVSPSFRGELGRISLG